MNTAFSIYNIYSDNMVFQRQKPIRIAGSAHKDATITATFAGNLASTTLAEAGEWVLEFPEMEAGGPYDLTITCDETPTTLQNILIGEVWYCSGQSNMEFYVNTQMPFYCLPNGPEVAATANDPHLRLFHSEHGLSLSSQCTNFPGRPTWKVANTPDAVSRFSAVAYYFGTFLRQKLGIPIGLIEASWGGTEIEAWMPELAFKKANREDIINQIALTTSTHKLSDSAKAILKIHEEMQQKELDSWFFNKFLTQSPEVTQNALANYPLPTYDDAIWDKNAFPGINVLSNTGIVWYRIHFTLPTDIPNATFYATYINDADETYCDGQKIGETLTDTPRSWEVERHYPLGTLCAGKHTIAIRHISLLDRGFFGDKVEIRDNSGNTICDLTKSTWLSKLEFFSNWHKIGVRPMPPNVAIPPTPHTNHSTPTIIGNAELLPATCTNIRGVIWYQGCSNAFYPDTYRTFQHAFIDTLRELWRDPNLTFILTQLAGCHANTPTNRLPDDWWKDEQPGDDLGYAPFRSMQEEFLDSAHTGVACTIDIGDDSDIHPANKLDVGKRLALEAMRLTYGAKDTIPGPRYQSHKIENGAIRIFFKNVGKGLTFDGGKPNPHLFSVAGEDGNFTWANATLQDESTLIISSPSVPAPVAARYAYTQCPPKANFRRKDDNIPVFPFETK